MALPTCSAHRGRVDGSAAIGRARVASHLAAIAVAALIVAACGTVAAPSTVPIAAVSPAPTPTAATPTVATNAAPTAVAPSIQPSPAVPTITAIPGAPDSGLVVELDTDGFAFSLTNIVAPAGKVWHLHVVRTGGNLPPNNFTLATGPTRAEWIFHSTNLSLGEHTFDIPAMPAGNYLFYCTIDPIEMHGTVTIK